MELKSIRKPLTDKQKIQLLRLCLKSLKKDARLKFNAAKESVQTNEMLALQLQLLTQLEIIDSVLDYDCKYFPEVAGVSNHGKN
jgi:hypothetical protein